MGIRNFFSIIASPFYLQQLQPNLNAAMTPRNPAKVNNATHLTCSKCSSSTVSLPTPPRTRRTIEETFGRARLMEKSWVFRFVGNDGRQKPPRRKRMRFGWVRVPPTTTTTAPPDNMLSSRVIAIARGRGLTQASSASLLRAW